MLLTENIWKPDTDTRFAPKIQLTLLLSSFFFFTHQYLQLLAVLIMQMTYLEGREGCLHIYHFSLIANILCIFKYWRQSFHKSEKRLIFFLLLHKLLLRILDFQVAFFATIFKENKRVVVGMRYNRWDVQKTLTLRAVCL